MDRINLKGISELDITGATSISIANGVISLTVTGGGGSTAWSALTGTLSNGQVIPYGDVGISRLGAASLAIGNGTNGDFTGKWTATTAQLGDPAQVSHNQMLKFALSASGGDQGWLTFDRNGAGYAGTSVGIVANTTFGFKGVGDSVPYFSVNHTGVDGLKTVTWGSSNGQENAVVAYYNSTTTNAILNTLALSNMTTGQTSGSRFSFRTNTSNGSAELEMCSVQSLPVSKTGTVVTSGISFSVTNASSTGASLVGAFTFDGTLALGSGLDVGISRLGAASLAIGNGSAGDFSGTLKLTIVNAATGYQVAGAATSGNVLRGNGTNFVSAQLAYSDLSGSPPGSATIGLTIVTSRCMNML